MSASARSAVVPAFFLLLTAAVLFAKEGPEVAPPGPALAGDTRMAAGWEYKAFPRSEVVQHAPGRQGEFIRPEDNLADLNAGLDVLGADGWELVAVEPYHKEGYVSWPAIYVFRRAR